MNCGAGGFDSGSAQRDIASTPGHTLVAPQQMLPQRLIVATADTHMFPFVQAGCMPHMHVPAMHASPSTQQVVPQVAPLAQVPDATQLSPSRCTEASCTAPLEAEHAPTQARAATSASGIIVRMT